MERIPAFMPGVFGMKFRRTATVSFFPVFSPLYSMVSTANAAREGVSFIRLEPSKGDGSG